MTNEWDQVAEDYSQLIGKEGDFFRQVLITPEILDVVGGLTAGSTVLDLGCGDGYVARLLSQKSLKLIGVDYSERLIELAKQKQSPGEFIVADITKPLLLNDRFDLIISVLALMDVSDLKAAYSNAINILRPNGILLVFITHPAFNRPSGRWAKTWLDKLLRRSPFIRIDKYGDEIKQRFKIMTCRYPITNWHRSLTEYIQIPIDMGLELMQFKELKPKISDVVGFNQPSFLANVPKDVMLKFIKRG